MLKIEKGVPLPKRSGAGNRKYPWHQMEVGDSIFIPGGTMYCSAYNAARNWFKRRNYEYAASTVEGGIRIWRKT